MASHVVYNVDMYYAYVVKSVIVDYLLLDQLIAPLVNRNKNLVVDLWLLMSPPQFASQDPKIIMLDHNSSKSKPGY
jgi:hypothetical protein